MIAHKLRTVQEAEQIIVLRDGQIAAQGTHDTLCETSEDYRRLWEISAQTQDWKLKEEVTA